MQLSLIFDGFMKRARAAGRTPAEAAHMFKLALAFRASDDPRFCDAFVGAEKDAQLWDRLRAAGNALVAPASAATNAPAASAPPPPPKPELLRLQSDEYLMKASPEQLAARAFFNREYAKRFKALPDAVMSTPEGANPANPRGMATLLYSGGKTNDMVPAFGRYDAAQAAKAEAQALLPKGPAGAAPKGYQPPAPYTVPRPGLEGYKSPRQPRATGANAMFPRT